MAEPEDNGKGHNSTAAGHTEPRLVWRSKRSRRRTLSAGSAPSPSDFGFIPSSPIEILLRPNYDDSRTTESVTSSCSSDDLDLDLDLNGIPDDDTLMSILDETPGSVENDMAELTRVLFDDLTSVQGLAVTFTREEDAWISAQTDGFYAHYFDVSFGEDFLKEFVMYSLDVPLSRHFVPQIMDTYAARYLSALQSLEDFHTLADNERKVLLERNLFKAVALSVSRVCRIPSGSEQLRFMMGSEDKRMLNREYENVYDTQQLKKLRMVDINRKTRLIKDQAMLDSYR